MRLSDRLLVLLLVSMCSVFDGRGALGAQAPRPADKEAAAQSALAPHPAQGPGVIPDLPSPAIEVFIAPDGKDSNPGTRQAPLATLEAARDLLRARRQGGRLPAGGAAVVLRGGTYIRKDTFRLEAQDSGTADAPVVFRAAEGESPILSGGRAISGFQPINDPAVLARLPAESRGKVLRLDLRTLGITDLGELRPRGFGRQPSPIMELFFDGKPMPLARWPNEGFVRVAKVIEPGGKPGTRAVFEYEGDRPSRWAAARDAWLFGYWHYLWADGTLPVASIDPAARRITTGLPYTYGNGIVAWAPFYAFNLLEEIDMPGEWYVDRAAGVLYFFPPGDLTKARVELSMLSVPLVELAGVEHVRLQGLVCELGRADGIVIRGGQRCLVAGCEVRCLGGDAVRIEGGRQHGVFGSALHTLGRGGARIQGGDRRTLAPSGHFMENCHVFDFSRVDRTYTPALWTDGVGTRVAHNRFHGSSCHAARLEGNDHLVEFNEVFDVVRESDDQGGMEMFGNPTYRGVVFRYNWFHDIGSRYDWPCGQAGIRLDDAISGIAIYGNVFQRCSNKRFGAVQIHGGKDNVLENNVFLDCHVAVSFSGWGKARWEQFLDSPRVVQQLTREVDISKPPYSTRYPELARLADNPDVNRLRRNLVIRCGAFLARDRGIQHLEENTVVQQASAEVGEVRDGRPYLPRELLEQARLRPIPIEKIGLYPHPLAAAAWSAAKTSKARGESAAP